MITPPPTTLLLIDSNALLHRAWHALPPLTANGHMVNALYGVLLMLFKVIPDIRPDAIIAAFDLKGPTFRHTLYTQYKAQRVKQPDELYEQIPMIKEVFDAMGITVIEKEGFEADDIIGTLATEYYTQSPSTTVLILTGDMDALQLVRDRVNVISFKKGVSETIRYTPETVRQRFELDPEQLIDYKSLRGDPSDNIPGVKGIGEQTATILLKKFHTVEGILNALNTDPSSVSPSIAKKILAEDVDLALNRKLVTIDCAVPLSYSLKPYQWNTMNHQVLEPLLRKYQFTSLIKKLEGVHPSQRPSTPQRPPAPKKQAATNDDRDTIIQTLRHNKPSTPLTITTATSPEEGAHATLTALALRIEDKQYFVNDKDTTQQPFREALCALPPSTRWIGHDLKHDLLALSSIGAHHGIPQFDTMIASYLLDSSSRAHSLEQLSSTILGRELSSATETQQELFQSPEGQRDDLYERLQTIQELVEPLTQRLVEEHLLSLYQDIELPLVPVLARMEEAGIQIDTDYLHDLGTTVRKKIERLEHSITSFAGESFNINSPLQLKRILFEVLKLPTKGIGKTKTGLSTAAEQLEKLADSHPIIPLLMEYRELAKLISTYIDALPKLIHPTTHRIHTHYNQTVAATGRLSSSDPNLQNIPIRTELGNEVRNAFIAQQGFRLVSLDYNQIELRVAASMAGDGRMIASFQSGEDIHARTAAEVFGVALHDVTPAMRRTAKTVNFGVLYGLGPGGLARTTGSTMQEAKGFIERYFSVYAGIRTLMEENKTKAARLGYVETLLGRRRYIPEIHSSAPQLRAQAERMAANMPLQGTAADMMKLAMIRIDAELPTWSTRARMALQVHDELVFEIPEDEVHRVADKARACMETVTTLAVPIVVHGKVGTRWGSMTALPQ